MQKPSQEVYQLRLDKIFNNLLSARRELREILIEMAEDDFTPCEECEVLENYIEAEIDPAVDYYPYKEITKTTTND